MRYAFWFLLASCWCGLADTNETRMWITACDRYVTVLVSNAWPCTVFEVTDADGLGGPWIPLRKAVDMTGQPLSCIEWTIPVRTNRFCRIRTCYLWEDCH